MEAFSLLKYWRGTGGGGTANVRTLSSTKTISTDISHSAAETDDDDGDEGPFFDLKFSVPDEDDGDEQEKQTTDVGDEEREVDDDDGTDGENEIEEEFKFTLSSGSSGDCTNPNASISPSDDLFLNGQLIPVEPSSIVIDGSDQIAKPPFSLLKSATNFRVLLLKLKKSKANAAEKTEPDAKTSRKMNIKQEDIKNQKQSQSQSKLFTMKFKVEEVPIVSLFTRDNSSRASSCINRSQKKENSDESASDEKRFSKDGMQKYLKMVKPLYIRVAKRYDEKSGFSAQLSLGGGIKDAGPSPTRSKSQPPPAESDGKIQKLEKLPKQLRVVCQHFGKSRSASSAALAAAPSVTMNLQGRRRDDSILEQHDGIQSAILHCKRSFNASRDKPSI